MDTAERSTTRLLARLDGRGAHAAAASAVRMREALDRAGSADCPASEALALDRGVLQSWKSSADAEAIAAHIDLDAVAGLAERVAARLPGAQDAADTLRRTAWDALDVLRRCGLLRRIEPAQRERWAARILALVEGSHFTVGPLLRQRAEAYGSKILFDAGAGAWGRPRALSWRDTLGRVESTAGFLLSAGDPGASPPRVALLSENRLEMALADLACLSAGIVDVMIPADSTEADVGYILRHSGASLAIVSGREQARKVLAHRAALAPPGRVLALDPAAVHEPGVELLDVLRCPPVDRAALVERSERVRISDLATLMYTSGTTGTPKGIRFSHRNIVFKRFARALALPEIGEDDVFLCYLPLYHTFGRFLEMLGCAFWGARYCFLEGTSPEALAAGMRRVRPTVFISVPKKWIQLHETVTRIADPLEATDDELRAAVEQATGGRLRWGLSAAGHLDPEIFRFFAAHGVELLSGFGMTEATGGITMTAPGTYRDNSLGTALPGIELRLAEDGELLVRGPYVMEGYLEPPGGEPSFDAEGFLHTGDLMERDVDGHLRLVDRKKEIYKNLQGQTIAPQRVENHFRGFSSVARVFLVGDHREYNTLLIYPDPAQPALDAEHFRSLVGSVNKFLAPYERIVDFAIIDRDLDPARGELTPKGTPRRKLVEQSFAELIRGMYRRASLRVGGIELAVPNWLFQLLGLTAQDIRSDGERIWLPASGATLTVRTHEPGLTQVGSCLYRHGARVLELGVLLTAPDLWLGNEELVRFVPLDTTTRQRQRRKTLPIEWAGRVAPYEPTDEDRAGLRRDRSELDLLDLDLAARLLASDVERDALAALDLLASVLAGEEGPLHDPARLLLERLVGSASAAVRRKGFAVLVPVARQSRLREILSSFLTADPHVLDAGTRETLAERSLAPATIDAFIEAAQQACETPAATGGVRGAAALLEFLAAYGTAHPISFRRLRAILERLAAAAATPEIAAAAAAASESLLAGFRRWLGPAAQIAVDPETGQEYRWDDVVAFADDVSPDDRRRLVAALQQTALLREAVFLFSQNASVRLSDIPPGGVWIRLLGSRHGKSVYRITVQTRYAGAYDVAVNLNHELTADEVREEIRWLILCGAPALRDPLVEDFGGFWPEQDLWTEEFIAGETLDRAMRRLGRLPDGAERLRQLWPFFAWATMGAHADFWNRSGRRLELREADMTNVVVPIEDYLSGVRVVSLTRRGPHRGVSAMLRGFRDELVQPAERDYPFLAGLVGWDIVFSAMLDAVGESDGLALLRAALDGEPARPDAELAAALGEWISRTERDGFVPLRLHSAIARYRRWSELNAEPTPPARALTLQELYETYGLRRLEPAHPDIRVRFFLETVFRDAPPELASGLAEIVRALRGGSLGAQGLIDAVDALRARTAPAEDHEYFLARMSYPYLRPEDAAGFVHTDLGGRRQSEIVVTLEDHDGRPFRVRHALNPREVERLLQLFLAAKLDVRFRIEHRHLVALSDRGQIIGGIYYEMDPETRSAHLEKIVVAERFRRKGVAGGLMNELFNRLRAAGMRTLTTGFFRPEYFYGWGFRIEKRYAGLVKSLEDEREA